LQSTFRVFFTICILTKAACGTEQACQLAGQRQSGRNEKLNGEVASLAALGKNLDALPSGFPAIAILPNKRLAGPIDVARVECGDPRVDKRVKVTHGLASSGVVALSVPFVASYMTKSRDDGPQAASGHP
jgi:hypothetical protein